MRRAIVRMLGSATIMTLASCGAILGIGEEPNEISDGAADAATDVTADADGATVVAVDAAVQPNDGSAVDAGFILTLETSMLHLRRGGTTSLALASLRSGGFDAPIVISTSPLPLNVSASSVTIATGSEHQSLTLSAATDATLGPATFTVNASAGGVTHSVTVDLLVQDAPGTPDTAFGAGGIAAISLAPSADRIGGEGLALQPDGKILLCGGVKTLSASSFYAAVARLDGASGALDTTFGTQGIAYLQGSDLTLCTSVQPLPSGGVVLAGFGSGKAFHTMGIVQLTAAGAPVTSFGPSHSGAVGIALSGADTKGYTLAVQSDGRMMIGGYSEAEGAVIVRLLSSGDLDPNFALGTGGSVSFGGLGSQSVVGMRLRGDETAVVAASSSQFLTAHLTAAGAVDTAYGDAGVGRAPTGVQIGDVGGQLAIQSGDRVVVSGSLPDGVDAQAPIQLARFGADGAIDPSFGSGGIVNAMIPGGDARPIAVAVAPDGRIAVAAKLPTGSFGVVRFTPDGVLDTSFAGVGYATTQVTDGLPEALAIDRYGRILVAGTATITTGSAALVVRYWP